MLPCEYDIAVSADCQVHIFACTSMQLENATYRILKNNLHVYIQGGAINFTNIPVAAIALVEHKPLIIWQKITDWTASLILPGNKQAQTSPSIPATLPDSQMAWWLEGPISNSELYNRPLMDAYRKAHIRIYAGTDQCGHPLALVNQGNLVGLSVKCEWQCIPPNIIADTRLTQIHCERYLVDIQYHKKSLARAIAYPADEQMGKVKAGNYQMLAHPKQR